VLNLKLLEICEEDAMYGRIHNRVSEIMGLKRMKIADLQKRAGIAHYTASELFYGRTSQISFEVLAKVCHALDAEVGDLFVYIPNGEGAPENGDAE
jgi:putative transcriptional regulator